MVLFLKEQALGGLAPGTFYASIIITTANSKDGCPNGVPKMVAPG